LFDAFAATIGLRPDEAAEPLVAPQVLEQLADGLQQILAAEAVREPG